MDVSKAAILFRKYREGTLSEEEKIILEKWYLNYSRSGKELPLPEDIESSLDEVWDRLSDQRSNMEERSNTAERSYISFSRRKRYLAGIAASFTLLLATYIFLSSPFPWSFTANSGTSTETADTHFSPARETGRSAYLTLSDGKKLNLEETSGLLAKEGALQVTKTKEGELVYSNTKGSSHSNATPGYHEVSTPMAGQYTIRLPDETVVWLNAGSRLRFPTRFDQDERSVELSGEAYFEVSKSIVNGKKIPFRVKTDRQVIEVLGTQFNVNGYADENSVKTTLVEGSISVNFVGDESNRKILLRPGQQLNYATGNIPAAREPLTLDVKQIDTRSATAWKNGYFRFDGISLEELMRQICRWYDMDVTYAGKFGKHEFVGEIERTAPLAEVLSILEAGNLSFRIEEKRIIVSSDSDTFREHS